MAAAPWPPFIISWAFRNEPGIEAEFIKDVARIINANLNVMPMVGSDLGKRSTTGEWSGLDGFLQNKHVDLLIGGLYTAIERPQDFETSHWYMTNTFAWIVPTARKFPESQIMWMMLRVSTSKRKTKTICVSPNICGNNRISWCQENHMKATLLLILLVLVVLVIKVVGIVEKRIGRQSQKGQIFTVWKSVDALLRGLVGKLHLMSNLISIPSIAIAIRITFRLTNTHPTIIRCCARTAGRLVCMLRHIGLLHQHHNDFIQHASGTREAAANS